MKKSRIAAAGLVILVVSMASISGQTAPQGPALGVVDSARAMENSLEGKKAIAQLRNREMKIRTDLAGLDGQIQSLETKLTTQKITLNLETQQRLSLDLEGLKTRRKRDEEDALKDFQRSQFSLFEKIRNEMLPIVETVAKEKGLSLVFDLSAQNIAYSHPSLDITLDVIKKYDAGKTEKK